MPKGAKVDAIVPPHALRTMPASFILFYSAAAGIALWVTARHYFRKRSSQRPQGEVQRLTNYAAWLEHRLDTARQERWDRLVILNLSEQLGTACEELARAKQHAPQRVRASLTALLSGADGDRRY